MEVAVDMLRDAAGARARETLLLTIELCGVFWIGAELLILFFLVEARRHLRRDPIPATPVWDRVATRRAAFFLLLLLAALLTVLARPLVWVPLSVRLNSGPLDLHSAAMQDFLAVQRHLAVWAAFVSVWVVLEAVIVYHGYRAYRVFSRRIQERTTGFSIPAKAKERALGLLLLGTLVMVGTFAVPAFAAPAVAAPLPITKDSWSPVLQMSEHWLYPYRNAVYLYLRLAGVVWIAVEWIAAWVLWRSHLRVSRALRARTTPQ